MYTLGPWIAKDKFVQCGDTGTTEDLLICKCFDNHLANACLIAVAPELLEAIKKINALTQEASISLICHEALDKAEVK